VRSSALTTRKELAPLRTTVIFSSVTPDLIRASLAFSSVAIAAQTERDSRFLGISACHFGGMSEQCFVIMHARRARCAAIRALTEACV
jgi:hypothetical protein